VFEAAGAGAVTDAGIDSTGSEGLATGWGTGVGITCLKKGRVRLPHHGILTSHPEEINKSSINIEQKIIKLFKVSRKLGRPSFIEKTLILKGSLCFPS
jgi:hypothetical protein